HSLVDPLSLPTRRSSDLALPMDLWRSRAIITSAAYKQLFEDGWIRAWDAKLYFNAVEHYMDDTKRPENLVHMDMPGWSTTYGLRSEEHTSELQSRENLVC